MKLVQVSFNDGVSKFKNKVSLANKQEIFSQNCRERYILIEYMICLPIHSIHDMVEADRPPAASI